ncbi:MAG: site-specific DNA-methyltransferase [Aestuariivita sp.]|nr:site-specific DNA-methyltransferase [Aestuariivita sp.]MCY4345416.1 site-specific DNA-methyltransferase [Aestuariivita sp.]
MNSASIDLIYLDPPFNSKTNYAAPIGSQAAGAEFKDTWTLNDIDIAWLDLIEAKHSRLWRVIQAAMTDSDKSYLIYMAARLLEIHRLLKPTGSIYLHCDPTMSHYLKLVMDAIWGHKQFKNEIVWCYSGPSNTHNWFVRKHDCILYYARTSEAFFNYEAVRVPHKDGLHNEGGVMLGKDYGKVDTFSMVEKGKLCPDWWGDIGAGAHIPKGERVGYPTQKPTKLLRRIIRASSNEGDVIFDPFCGCATTCIAAQDEGREWVGIDISPKAADLVISRLRNELGMFADKSVCHRTESMSPNRLSRNPMRRFRRGSRPRLLG